MIDGKAQRINLERARGHVDEAEVRVAAQYERVRKLHVAGEDSRHAEALLHAFSTTLDIMRERLAVEEMRQDTGRSLLLTALDKEEPLEERLRDEERPA